MALAAAGTSRAAFLLSTAQTDVDLSFTTWLDKPATGGGVWIYGTFRRATDGSAYRPKIRIDASGAVYALISKVTSSGESPLGSPILVPGLTAAPGVPIHIRAQATGSYPTMLRIRVWADSVSEPSTWLFSVTDSTAQLQQAGSIGFIAYASSNVTNAPYAVHFGNLAATSDDDARLDGVTFVGAGDIASCNSMGDEQTARIMSLIGGTQFTLGDNVYENATAQEFANCFDPSWGQLMPGLHPTIGNHEYNTPNAAPYFDYFGAAAGTPGKGWYAFNVGTWRVYVLNANCGIVSCAVGSEQETWLRNDLAANNPQCSIAMWHQPRFSSGSEHGSSPSTQPLWQDVYDAGVEIVLNGHDHDYERFAPLNASGNVDTVAGVREFVVGTGGASLRTLSSTVVAGSEVRQASTYGVLKLTLGAGAYEWEYVPVAGATWTDRGSGTCH
jgi:hypothetical protein